MVRPEIVAVSLSPTPALNVVVRSTPDAVAMTMIWSMVAPLVADFVSPTVAVPLVDPAPPFVDTELINGAAGTSALMTKVCVTGVATP
jgi:hypothetical protein